jgi:aldose 1-epimerase
MSRQVLFPLRRMLAAFFSTVLLSTLFPVMMNAQYGVSTRPVDGVETIHLEDTLAKTMVTVVPGIGNLAHSMKVNGTEVFWSPFESLAALRAKPAQAGNPFLAPFANRIEGLKYFVNGKPYLLNPELGTVRVGNANNPIHGSVMFTDQWKVLEVRADAEAAWVRSRLEFWRIPGFMAQFPFAHTIEMTYRLSRGRLEVITEIENYATEPMPVAVGYHPWFQIPGGRDSWTVHLAASEHLELSESLIPTGKRNPMALPSPYPLKGNKLDDVFTSLRRSAEGTAEFWVTNGKQKLSVVYGPKYGVAVVYAPPGRDVICFEPMAAITDAFNQHHKGKYPELQSIAPGGRWRESFFVVPSGF